ncbi:MAG: hypothetical protein RR206_04810 [Bacteroidaceae bacterium]
MARTYEELLETAETIRTNLLPESNTANLVGGLLKEIIQMKGGSTGSSLKVVVLANEDAYNALAVKDANTLYVWA